MRKITALVLALGLVGALAPGAASEPKFKTVWEDDAGDAGLDEQPTPGFTQMGLDLVEGAIARDGTDLIFKVTMAEMPPFGSFPEAFRFLWTFAVGSEVYRLTIKRADVGKPDAGQGQTGERVGRVDVDGHFRLEGNCQTDPAAGGVSFVNCRPLEYLEGEWDPADASVTMVVPMEAVGAKPRSILTAGNEGICGICWVSHLAERSSDRTIIDTANWTSRYRVPRRG